MATKRPTNKLVDVGEPQFGLNPIGLRRDMNAYTVTESELNSLGSVGERLTIFLWLSGLGLSFGTSAMITAASVPNPWSAQQWALFHYLPWIAIPIGFVFLILSISEIRIRTAEVDRIKREHKFPAEVRAIPPE